MFYLFAKIPLIKRGMRSWLLARYTSHCDCVNCLRARVPFHKQTLKFGCELRLSLISWDIVSVGKLFILFFGICLRCDRNFFIISRFVIPRLPERRNKTREPKKKFICSVNYNVMRFTKNFNIVRVINYIWRKYCCERNDLFEITNVQWTFFFFLIKSPFSCAGQKFDSWYEYIHNVIVI